MDARDGDDVNVQAEYDADPELQGSLSRAARSPTVQRDRAQAVDDAHGDRVRASTERALTEHANLFRRLKDADTGNAE